MPGESFAVRPQFRETNQAGMERIFRRIVSDASIGPVCGCYQRFQVRPDFRYTLGRKSERAKNCDGWIHRYTPRNVMMKASGFLLVRTRAGFVSFMAPGARG